MADLFVSNDLQLLKEIAPMFAKVINMHTEGPFEVYVVGVVPTSKLKVVSHMKVFNEYVFYANVLDLAYGIQLGVNLIDGN